MKKLFYDTKIYEKEAFDKIINTYEDAEIEYLEADISRHTVRLSKGFDAVCVFVASDVNKEIIENNEKIQTTISIQEVVVMCDNFINNNTSEEDFVKWADGIIIKKYLPFK